VHDGNAYRVHPAVHVWVDVEEFEQHLAAGRRQRREGQHAAALAEYEAAVGLYRGDLIADSRYDDWSALPRERLRLAYLDALGQLSMLHFAERRYEQCAQLCRRLLEQDPCNEPTRRLLMRCYARQGRPHLALFEFRACAEALASQLQVTADPATRALRDRISGHQPV
jgi:DNA-binding SARP family transcriptional activator